MDDHSNLTDEELDAKIAEAGEEEAEQPAEPETLTEEEQEEAPEETEEQPEEAEEEAEQPEEKEEPKPPSRREQLRIQQLLQKMKQQPQAQAEPESAPNFSEMIDADEEVIQQLQNTTQQYGQQQRNAGLEQVKAVQFHTRLEIDAPKVESKFPQLNKDSEEFNPSLADAVNTWYLQTTGYDPRTDTVANPNVRYAEFVEGIFELGNTIGSQKSQATAKNVAKQATQTGLRPDGSQAKRMNLNQAPQTMSDEELDAIISQSIPKK